MNTMATTPDTLPRGFDVRKYVERMRRQSTTGTPCPECGGPLIHGEGCFLCPVCGFSNCG